MSRGGRWVDGRASEKATTAAGAARGAGAGGGPEVDSARVPVM